LAQQRVGRLAGANAQGPVDTSCDTLGAALLDLVGECIADRLHRSGRVHREAVEVQELTQLAQAQLAVAPQQRERGDAQLDAVDAPRLGDLRGQGRLVGSRGSGGPARPHRRPQQLVDFEGALDEHVAATHPVDGLVVEGIEGIDHLLADGIPVLVARHAEPGCSTGDPVWVVGQPSGGGRQ
jgi:hypothetical protein